MDTRQLLIYFLNFLVKENINIQFEQGTQNFPCSMGYFELLLLPLCTSEL